MISDPKNITPYYENVYKWVDSIDYSPWGCHPFSSPYGVDPEIVYKRLFEEKQYYILSEEELSQLRSTIQYKVVYLNNYLEKVIKFLEDCGFTVYMRNPYKRNGMIGIYLKRDNISLFISNVFTPQCFIPNAINLEISVYVVSKKTGKKRRKQLETFAHIPVADELGEKTKELFEEYLNNIVR